MKKLIMCLFLVVGCYESGMEDDIDLLILLAPHNEQYVFQIEATGNYRLHIDCNGMSSTNEYTGDQEFTYYVVKDMFYYMSAQKLSSDTSGITMRFLYRYENSLGQHEEVREVDSTSDIYGVVTCGYLN